MMLPSRSQSPQQGWGAARQLALVYEGSGSTAHVDNQRRPGSKVPLQVAADAEVVRVVGEAARIAEDFLGSAVHLSPSVDDRRARDDERWYPSFR